jgi:hypothetical protein
MTCAECGGIGSKLAIFAGGSGHNGAFLLCAACWKAAQDLGGPGVNVAARVRDGADAARTRRDNAPLVPGVPGVRRG